MNRYWLLLIGFPFVATPAGWGGYQRVKADHALQVLALPPTLQATILRKAWIAPSGRRAPSPYYQVVLRLPDREVAVRVSSSDYASAMEGATTGWHVDPATGAGIADLERMERTTGMMFPYGLAFALAFILCSGMWQGLPGGAGEARVKRGGEARILSLETALPAPPREETDRRREWLAKKYPPLRRLLTIPLVGAAPFAVGFGLAGWMEPAAILIVYAAMACGVILASRSRGLARDRALWRDGLELPVTSLEATVSGKVWLISASFMSGGEPFTLTQRWPVECDRPADSVLVDPQHLDQATAAPRR